MLIQIGSRYERQLINEAIELVKHNGNDAVKTLALAIYQLLDKHHHGEALTLRDRFYLSLVYSEFLDETGSDEELCACEDRRQIYCRRLGIDSFKLFKATENTIQPGRYQ